MSNPNSTAERRRGVQIPLLVRVIFAALCVACVTEVMRGVSDLGQLARSIALPETLFFSADTSPALDSRNSANQRRDRQEQDSVVATEPQSEIPEPPLREEQEKLAETTGETKIEEQVDVSVETKTGNEQSPIPEETKAATDETTSEESHEPLNIILLYGDDWRHDSIGSAKASIVRTPFFDWLATQGMKFIHNCVTTSVCWISRATLYTGLYVSRHKSDYPHKPLWYEGWNDSWPQLLKEKGYYQGHSGKWHFDWRELVWSTFDFSNAFYGDHWYQENGRLIHTTKKNERDALKFLKNRPKDKPFMLSVCFFAPHSVDGTDEQYFPQNETMSLYENETVAVPVSATEEAWKKLPYFFGDINEGRRRWRIRFDTPEKHQRMMKNYFRLITEIDQTSEVIYKELVKQGVENKTMIIFTTDNGLYHSEHQLAGKWYPHQESIRVPLIIRDPRMPKDKIGTINEDFTLNIDLASTILGAAGVKQPSVMQGRDISDLYLKSAPKWRQEFFYEHPVHLDTRIIPASTALVRKKYKFMTWPDYKVEQLFDLEKDPLELDDLINSTDVADIISEMRIRHEELKQAALEPGPVDKSAKRIILQSRGAVDK